MARKFLQLAKLAVIVVIGTPSAMSAQSWEGAFYGGSLGVGGGEYALGVAALDEVGPTLDVTGFVYGTHAGVQFQRDRLVYGVDAGVIFGPDGTQRQQPLDLEGLDWQCVSGACNIDLQAIATLRAKVGYVTDIRTLVYAAGGLAVARVEGGILNSPQQGQSTASGTTYAIGVERITSPFSTIFAELGYYDLGTLTFGTNEGEIPPPATITDFTASGDFFTITAGINYKF